jgi:acyl-CoA dehydrogenase
MNAAAPQAAQAAPSNVSILAERCSGDLDVRTRARRVAEVAARHAPDVDQEGRVPAEAIAALKAERLMGVLAPRALGGEDARHGDVVEACYILGQACASTALIYAMHSVKVACLVRHSDDSLWHQGFIGRVAGEQMLLASSTTEGATGGAVRSSDSAIVHGQGRIRLERDASVISYGEAADGLVTTARRNPDAAPSDQVLVALARDDYSLTRTRDWSTLGMRGTVSAGFALKAEADPAQILPQPYARIHAESMVPSAHLFWSSAWTGVAAAAVDRARRAVRKSARAAEGPLPAAARLAKAMAALRAARAQISAMTTQFEAIQDDRAALTALEFQTAITLLKVDVSELAVEAVTQALRATGLSGYRTDGEASLARHLRDVLSAPLMINNDRILADLATTSLVADTPQSIRN